MTKKFTCEGCGGIFDATRTDEDAIAEKEALYGEIPLDQCAVVCGNCFILLHKLMSANKLPC